MLPEVDGSMLKQAAVRLLRHAGILPYAELLRFRLALREGREKRRLFEGAHPGVELPPEDVIYDAWGWFDWEGYWTSGQTAALYLARIIKTYLAGGRVLEWGCGPARIVRHLPDTLGAGFEIIGTDYNTNAIAWCREYVKAVRFEENRLAPPLPFEAGSIACIYAISVFTHLSEAEHYAWIRHLFGLLEPGGLLIFSTHSDATRHRLFGGERRAYERGELVVRGNVEEGRRAYLAYHPVPFVQRLLNGFELVRHEPSPVPISYLQDLWIARKPVSNSNVSSRSVS